MGRALPLLLTLLAAVPPAADPPADRVVVLGPDRRTRVALEGTVVEDSWKQLVLSVRGTRRSFPRTDVVSVALGAPSELVLGLQALDEGDLGRAGEGLEAVLSSAAAKGPWVLQDALFGLAQCRRRAGRSEDALAFEERLRHEVRESKHLPAMAILDGRDRLDRGDPAGAEASFRKLRDDPSVAAFGAEFLMSADFWRAKALLALGREAEARALLEATVRDGAAGAPKAAARAEAELARISSASGGPERAAQVFRDLLLRARARDDAVLTAGAACGLGDAELALGRYDDAALTYSRAYAPRRFFSDPDLRDEVAYALAKGAEAFARQAESRKEPDADAKRATCRERAERLRARVVAEFPGTEGARQELGAGRR